MVGFLDVCVLCGRDMCTDRGKKLRAKSDRGDIRCLNIVSGRVSFSIGGSC